MLSMGLGMIDPNNPITELNSKLHQSDLYNGFQMSVSMVSSFTGAASQNMACFIAGTMVLTTAGLVAIEKIKAGDIVISTNPDTFETAPKTVLETYVRQVDKLVHLTINGEEIVTTIDHPFYVQGRGFIDAANLLVGDKLISVNGEDLLVFDCIIEDCDSPTTVYNFQVEDYHTYFVGECNVWVHNTKYNDPNPKINEILKDKNLRTDNNSLLQYDDFSGKGYEKALNDFNHLEPVNTKTIKVSSGGEGMVGTLDDGRKIIVRPTSGESSPTLEIQFKSRRKIKIRYQ